MSKVPRILADVTSVGEAAGKVQFVVNLEALTRHGARKKCTLSTQFETIVTVVTLIPERN